MLPFAPSEILCSSCEYRDNSCEYYNQRRDRGPGVYFVTLHMLRYLQDRIPTPDLIILDENLKSGLMLEDACYELQMKSILKIVNGMDAVIIKHLLNSLQQISTNLVVSKSEPMILNGRKITEASNQETTIIELLARCMNMSDENFIDHLTALSTSLENLSRRTLYRQEVDLNAVAWICGLTSTSILSFVLIDKNGNIEYRTKRITPLGYHNTPIKILDATGNAKAYKTLIDRHLKTVKADVPWNSYRVHINISTSRTTMKFARELDLIKLLTEMLSYTAAQQIMVITYKAYEEGVMDILCRIDQNRQFMSHHFNGPRGINNYQSCDAALVIGLPYPNLNSAAQDACILFPYEKDTEERMEWIEACMQWELVQCIHRIRPVHKSNVDIILAGNQWPSIFPKPDKVIDRSQNTNWKELTIQRLKPFVEEFGFLNQDIGFLANVYVKSKDNIAKQFKSNMSKLLSDVKNLIPEFEGNLQTSQLFELEDIDNCVINQLKAIEPQLEEEKIKLILALNISYNQNLLVHKNLFLKIIKLLKKQNVNWSNDDYILSNPNQWADLLIHFKEQYSHFEKFEIKLPHARGNAVNGVGNLNRVMDFYTHINKLGIVGRINIESYRSTEACHCPVTPVPDGYVSTYIPEDEKVAYFGWGTEFTEIPLNEEVSELKRFLEHTVIIPGMKIITNDGKHVAKTFLLCELPWCEIIDVVIAEKLIANGEVEYRAVSLKKVFKRHGLPEEFERNGLIHKLVDIWINQEPLIKSASLVEVFDIESRLIWVTAKIETTGIGINANDLLGHYDYLNAKLDTLTSSLAESIPEGIPLSDRNKIKEHLNSAHGLSLLKIDDNSMKLITSANVRHTCEKLIQYWETNRERQDVESYIIMTDPDDRVRDSIDQLNTKTGRFYRPLQKVKKDGPMRSFFQAMEGYTFIIADYSQQEARIIAGLSDDQVALDLFKTGKDIYLETANFIIGNKMDEGHLRTLGKEIVLGLNNGQSAYSIFESLEAMGFGYDPDDIQGMIFRYNMTFSGINSWRDGAVSNAENDKIISTPMGRTLRLHSDVKINSLYNYPVQGTASDGFKLTLIDLDHQLDGIDARIVHILHDEVIVEAREDIAESVSVLVKNCMEKAFEDILPNVPMVVKPVVRDSWGVRPTLR